MLLNRIGSRWATVRSSLWFLPTTLTIAAAALATFTVWLDQHGFATPETNWFILVAGAEGARGVLSTIAGSIITVTGVVFSITIVVLQLASSQFSPRVLRSFTEDRANQLVLGVFIGTFTYALLVLRTVRSEFADYTRFVPTLSVNTAVLLALISMGFLIYFINHIARAIQAESIIARVTKDAVEVIDRLFPEELGDGADESDTAGYEKATPQTVITAADSGYLQSVDSTLIMRLAEEHDMVLRLEQNIGAFIVAGDSLISVLSGPREVPAAAINKTIALGAERTRFQDVERGLIELTDIAVRALSPGINDPTTATVCIHRLTQVFTRLGTRRFPATVRKGKDGHVRVVAPAVSFEPLLTLAYGPIRVHAASNPAVLAALEDSLQRLVARLPAGRRPALIAEIDRTQSQRKRS